MTANKPVYIVLEHHTERTDAKIHGVYTTRNIAMGKVAKLTLTPKPGTLGYLCILKKTPEGPAHRQLEIAAAVRRLSNKWGQQSDAARYVMNCLINPDGTNEANAREFQNDL